MILAFDMTNSDTAHVPFNTGLCQAMAAAFPQARIRFHAEAGHVAALSREPALGECGNVELVTVALSPHFRWRTHIVSIRRLWREFATLREALRRAPAEPHLIVLASTTPTAIAAALMVARMARHPVAVQVGLHGNLNEINGWRPRNPLRRRYDLRSMLSRPRANMRLLVFESSIRESLARILPATEGRVDVLDHPVHLTEVTQAVPLTLAAPLRIALVGMATEAKGITPYLEIARALRERHGAAVEFHIVGGRAHTMPAARFGDIAHPVEIGHIPREVFAARLGRMHYVLLPLQAGYYNLSPSGGMMDALAWAKPLIATRVPMTEALFAAGGDIGHLCDGTAGLEAALETVLLDADAARYAGQAAALARLRERRAPGALAPLYREIVARGFGGILS